MSRITCEADLEPGVAALAALDPAWAAIAERAGPPPLRLRADGFGGLCAIVVSQQLSVASARAVQARFDAVFPQPTPDTILAAGDEAMRLSGLSRPKQRTMRALAAAITEGRLDLPALREATPEAVHATLCAVPGIGPWTADIYLLFCLGHADAFAAGDLALQEAARAGFGLPARPDARALTALAEGWRPWRGVAARLLFAYYAALKRREGLG